MLFSGDKLLGGPQCGVIAGTKRAVECIESDPLMRALRLDKLVLAALEATLRLALDAERGAARIPLWAMAGVRVEALSARAAQLARTLCDRLGYQRGGGPIGCVPWGRERSDSADSVVGRCHIGALSGTA